jgi:hypothetical protein
VTVDCGVSEGLLFNIKLVTVDWSEWRIVI